MSRFFSPKYSRLVPYVPGEQPRDRRYIKLNTNESPYPPSPIAQRMAREEAGNLELYSDPECRDLVAAAAEYLGVDKECVLFTNGSDDALNFAFMSYCDDAHPARFPDVTYGFYPVFAEFNRVPYETVPLDDTFVIHPEDYIGKHQTVFLANPNAPTGLAMPLSDVERIVAGNPDAVVVVDEAYVDFGAESAIPLTEKYDNLLVVGTFSKSRSLAGGRLGFAIGCRELIRDLNTVRYSTNPYNINRMTMAAGIGALADTAYFESNRKKIMETRTWTEKELTRLGFTFPPSSANFIFAKHKTVGGERIYQMLREKGILVRHFSQPRIADYNRITVGNPEEMRALIAALEELL